MSKVEVRRPKGRTLKKALAGAASELCDDLDSLGGVVVTWDADGFVGMMSAGHFPDDVDGNPDQIIAAMLAGLAREIDPHVEFPTEEALH